MIKLALVAGWFHNQVNLRLKLAVKPNGSYGQLTQGFYCLWFQSKTGSILLNYSAYTALTFFIFNGLFNSVYTQ